MIIICSSIVITSSSLIISIVNSLIADSSDKGSNGRQKKSNRESKVTFQILSTVESKGTNIGARKWPPHNVTRIVRNDHFVRPDHRSHGQVRDLRVEVVFLPFPFAFGIAARGLFTRSHGMFLEFGVAARGLCLFRVLSRSRSKRLRKGIENIKKTSARRP